MGKSRSGVLVPGEWIWQAQTRFLQMLLAPHAEFFAKEGVDVILKALSEEELTYHGKRFRFEKVPMILRSLQKPHPTMWYGLHSVASADRVARQGFNAGRISDIADEAGVAHGLVYHYFENKDAVFKAILEAKLEHARAAMEDDDSLPGSALDRMRESLGRWLDRVRSEPEMSLMITQALVSDALSAEARQTMEVIARNIRQCQAASLTTVNGGATGGGGDSGMGSPGTGAAAGAAAGGGATGAAGAFGRISSPR